MNPYTDHTTEPEDFALQATIAPREDPTEITLCITAEKGTAVKVDGAFLTMHEHASGTCVGAMVYRFTDEDTKIFKIKALNQHRKKEIEAAATCRVSSPALKFIDYSEAANSKNIVITGVVKDVHDRMPRLEVNGETLNVSTYTGAWEHKVVLNDEVTKLNFVATNKFGRATVVPKIIRLVLDAPVVEVDPLPINAGETSLLLTGAVRDKNDPSPTLTVNGTKVHVSNFSGKWKHEIELEDGLNFIDMVATNSFGKSTTETRAIQFGVSTPVLTVTEIILNKLKRTATISGTVKDQTDKQPVVKINGDVVSVSTFSGNWEKEVILYEATNTFNIVATNKLGKSATVTKFVDAQF